MGVGIGCGFYLGGPKLEAYFTWYMLKLGFGLFALPGAVLELLRAAGCRDR